MATKKESDLTLSDRLSRLSYSDACKVLGPRGKSLPDVDAVELASGMEELRRRLELLLGARPEAPVDESQRAEREDEVATLAARRERVAAAGGKLVTAAFTLLGELLPPAAAGDRPESRQTADLVRTQLARCIQRDPAGRPKLTVTLPDPTALDTLAESLGRLLVQAAPAGQTH